MNTDITKPTDKTEREAVALPRLVRFVVGMGRNPGEEKLCSHLYAEYDDGSYLPMCQRGWNRSDGERFSILRGHVGARGVCKTCQKNADAGKPGVKSKPGSHKTQWL